jgi:hypothetical protein
MLQLGNTFGAVSAAIVKIASNSNAMLMYAQRRPSPAGRAARRLPLFANGVTRETAGCMAMLDGTFR